MCLKRLEWRPESLEHQVLESASSADSIGELASKIVTMIEGDRQSIVDFFICTSQLAKEPNCSGYVRAAEYELMQSSSFQVKLNPRTVDALRPLVSQQLEFQSNPRYSVKINDEEPLELFCMTIPPIRRRILLL